MFRNIIDIIKKNILTTEKVLKSSDILKTIEGILDEIIFALKNNKKILLCGNGGSAADAQHIAAELSGRFYKDREPLYAEALHVNTSYLTAVANDYSYDEVYSRLIKAKGRAGDILIAISTSGNSTNVIKAIETANSIGMITIGLTGGRQCLMDGICKYLIKIPSEDTPRIQENHILIGHIICELVEGELFI